MNNQNISDLYNKLSLLVDAGDEGAVRTFLVEHIKEFPVEAQKKIVFEFFADAVDKKLDNDQQIDQIQKEGLQSLKDIEKAESGLADKGKLDSVRASLGL